MRLLKSLFLSLFILAFVVVGAVGAVYFGLELDKLEETPYFIRNSSGEFRFLKLRPPTWLDDSEVSVYARWAVLVSEDWAFYDHHGIDFNQVEDALNESLEEGKLVRGASTITQQVVKNLFLSSEKTLKRKLVELILTLYLENTYSKNQILTWYFNLIELGEGIYGLKAASKHYFKKHPSFLSAREGAFLAMLLPSPVRYSVSYRKRELTEFAANQIEVILIKLRQAKIITEEIRLEERQKTFDWEGDY